MKDNNNDIKIGVYICHCGSNIAGTVDVEKVTNLAADAPHVVIAREYKFMCSEPGQDFIIKDIKEKGLNRVIVASCSPLMHEPTFRKACEKANLNRYLFQMVNIREQCSWVHKDIKSATEKASALINAAIRRVVYQEPLETFKVNVNPNTLVVGGGIAGIQAALEIAESGNKVYLVEKKSTIGGKMAKFDKTFPTLDCSACILTPKMVSVAQHENIELLSYSEIEDVEGSIGDFKIKVRKKARYVHDNCTSCDECTKVCPVQIPNPFDENQSFRSAVYKTFPQAIPNTYVIDKEDRPPCRETCPIGQEAAGYIGLVAQGRFEEAASLIREQNPLPIVCGRVCYHPCESECNRKFVDEPIAIKNIKRFVIDWEMNQYGGPKPPIIEKKRSEKIAIIGSGPSGLACAHDLALKGYEPIIYEKLPVPGGMLAVGIPEYRLPKKLLNSEIDYIKGMGVSIKTGIALGKDFSIKDLFKQGYKAIYIATGAHKSLKMKIPGEEEFVGVYHGVDFLRNINLGNSQPVENRVAVIGGGNTATDAARTALRRGAKEVTILYRRTRKEMPAEEAEIQAAEEEGVKIQYLIAPVEVLGKSGKVVGLKCINMELGEPDSSGRRRPVPLEGSKHDLGFDMVIIAVSQSPDIEFVDDQTNFKLSKWNTFEVNQETLETNVQGVFAGGDVVKGPATVILAMGYGKRAAEAIDKLINKKPMRDFKTHINKILPERDENSRPHSYAPKFKDTLKKPRIKMKELDPKTRCTNFEEVELGFSEEEAKQEAARCLNCGICIECHACERVCEAKSIDHNMKDEIIEINVGQVLITTGFNTLNCNSLIPYGYGEFENVYTSLEFERIVSSTGPTQGNIVMKNGKEPRAIGIIHCVGSRDINYHPYCSRVCCMYALKFAHLIKDRTKAEVYQFYIDMRSFGKGYEEFYSRILEEGVNVIRGKVAEVAKFGWSNNGDEPLIVRCEDTLIKKYREIPVDMVILCNAIEPQPDAEKIQRLFSISRSPDGFFLEKHPKLDPTATATDGVYIAGCCQGPKDIPDSVAQASSAAARILANISKEEIEVEPIQAYIDPELCAGCRLCNNLCPYGAISFDEEENISKVNEALCKGCGTCVASCPSSAATAKHFSDEQIFAEIEGILE
ncbi:MAG: FAD-dependent oxidoreductase [Candidatus Aminicenantes bacterium]|nr:FAD-dependent oxidoreductase [Candidatus Aminicenantes bacterium]